MRERTRAATRHYTQAKDWLLASPYHGEVLSQALMSSTDVTETQFLREYAWVVLNSGFREAVIRQRFDYISLCFCDWESAASIVLAGPVCVSTALPCFRNDRKLQSIFATAEIVDKCGFSQFYERVLLDPANVLDELPYIGSVTALHLAKNLGFDVPKPDRHLIRLAARFGYQTVYDLCVDLSDATGDQKSVIDLILWRFEERTFAQRRGEPR